MSWRPRWRSTVHTVLVTTGLTVMMAAAYAQQQGGRGQGPGNVFTGKTTVDETTITGVSGIFRRDLGVQVDHAFRCWLIGTARFGYGFDTYPGSPREDDRFLISAALTYKLSRELHLKGEVRQEWLRSTFTGNDYDATVVMLGLRVMR